MSGSAAVGRPAAVTGTTVVRRPRPGDALVLRALGLGDALTGVAALRGARRAWPDRRLVLASPEPLGLFLARRGVVDAVLPTDGLAPAWEPDAAGWPGGHLAVDLHGRGPQSHRLLLVGRPRELVAFAHPDVGNAGPDWRPEEHEVARWCRLLTGAGGPCGPDDLRLTPGPAHGAEGPVVLHPGAASGARRWPTRRWGELARRLAAAGHRVVLTGSRTETALADAVRAVEPSARSLAGRLDLDALAALLSGARLLVCGDTGVAHLGTALATPSVLLFGPTPPSAWGPALDPDLHTVLWRGDVGRPGDPHAPRTDPALAALGVEEVWQAAAALLARAGRRAGEESLRRSG